MEILEYNGFRVGDRITMVSGNYATIVSLGSAHITAVDNLGNSIDMRYPQTKSAIKKTAQDSTIKSDDIDGREFSLIRDEDSSNQKLVVQYRIVSGEDTIWESETITTNVYSSEYGWSAPDDFDEQKLGMIQQKAEMGFDLLMESYSGIVDSVSEEVSVSDTKKDSEEDADGDVEEPKGEPAFAPGEGPEPGLDSDMDTDIDSDDSLEGGSEEVAIEDIGEDTAEAGLNANFSRSILSSMERATELLRNPQHRISPITRKLMKERGIDSGSINDIELADALKDSNYEL